MSDARCDELERRVDQLETQVALIQKEQEHILEGVQTIRDRIDGMNNKKLDPMREQLTDLHTSLYKQKGFRAGVVFTVTAFWAVFTTLGIAIWNYFSSNGPSGG